MSPLNLQHTHLELDLNPQATDGGIGLPRVFGIGRVDEPDTEGSRKEQTWQKLSESEVF